MDLEARRLKLHTILLDVMGDNGHVYFQPPSTLTIQYPCIVYNRDDAKTEFADNNSYRFTQRYQVKVISREPNTALLGQVAALPSCSYDRFYTADNLNHDVFNVFF